MLELLNLVLLLIKLAIDSMGDANESLCDALLHRNWLNYRLGLLHEGLAQRQNWLENGVHQAQRAA